MDPAEAAVVDQITVRLIEPQEQDRWNQLVSQHHYLKNANLVGERLCYVAEYQGQWLALLGWSAAAYHIRARDQWIGWNDNQRRARLPLVANNARFCLLTRRANIPIWPAGCWLSIRPACPRTGRKLTGTRSFWWKVLWTPSFFAAPPTRPPVGGRWASVRVSNGWRRIFMKPTTGPSNSTRGNWSNTRPASCARDTCPSLQKYERYIDPSCQMPGEELTSLWQIFTGKSAKAAASKVCATSRPPC